LREELLGGDDVMLEIEVEDIDEPTSMTFLIHVEVGKYYAGCNCLSPITRIVRIHDGCWRIECGCRRWYYFELFPNGSGIT
jgi:hypothetical protein